jgi:hypothetical protein
MSAFDEDAYMENLARWANEPLRTFRVEGWPVAPTAGAGSGLSGMSASGPAIHVVMTEGVHHARPGGGWVDVRSHRPDDVAGIKAWAPHNLILREVKRELPADVSARKREAAVRRALRAADSGETAWTTQRIPVDGEDVDFDVMARGDGWAAFAALDEIVVTIDAHRVDRHSIRLVTTDAE